MATFISKSPAETEAVGQQFAEDIGPGSTLALKGELGSGKTMFVKGLVAGLGTCMNIEEADYLFTISIFFAWKIENPSFGLASMITFSATAFQ